MSQGKNHILKFIRYKSLHQRYTDVLGIKKGDELTAMIDAASNKLGDPG